MMREKMSKKPSTERHPQQARSGQTRAPKETEIGFHRDRQADAFTIEGAPPPAVRTPHLTTTVRNSP